MVPRFADGSLAPPEIEAVMPLENAAEAHRKLDGGEIIGKIVLSCHGEI